MKRLLILAVTIGLSACWQPPFDEDIALAASATQKMELVYKVSFSGFPENGTFFPIPEKQILGGFVIVDDPEDVTVKFLTRSFSSNEEKSGIPVPVYEGMDPFYSQIFGPFTSTPLQVQFFPGAPDPDSTWDQDVLVQTYSVSTRVFEFVSDFDFMADVVYPQYFAGLTPAPAIGDLNLSGFHMYPDADMNIVVCHVLVYRTSENSIYELKFTINTAGNAAFSENINLVRSAGLLEKLSVPEGYEIPEKAAYFYSPSTQTSYINVQDNGTYRTARWTANEAPEEIIVEEKILAVLTSGEILSSRNGYGRVYSSAGRLQYRFPLGELMFKYETYKSGNAVMVFSHKYTDGLAAVFSVYTHPTADLSGLR
jgi:hypothetical protein